MCERRSHCNFPSKMDYKCQSDIGFGRRKHHRRHHHSDKQFWSEQERTWTGERLHHGRQQTFHEFEKHNHNHNHNHHHRQQKQFEGHHHCNQQFSPFQQFSKPEGCKFGRHHFHQKCQFPFQFEGRFHQQFWPFARPEKIERHHKHHCNQQFVRQETCERRHPQFGQFLPFNEPFQFERSRNCFSQWKQREPFQPFEKSCQFERRHKHHCNQQFGQFRSFNVKHCKCHPSFRQFGPLQPFEKPCQFERRHKHHCNQQFSPCGRFSRYQQFVRQETCQRRLHHQCGRFGPLSQFCNFGQFDKHHQQFRKCPSFGPLKHHCKCCSPCRRTYQTRLLRRQFCGSKLFEDSRIQRRMFMKQHGRYPIKHHFHHHKAHRFHHHKSHW